MEHGEHIPFELLLAMNLLDNEWQRIAAVAQLMCSISLLLVTVVELKFFFYFFRSVFLKTMYSQFLQNPASVPLLHME